MAAFYLFRDSVKAYFSDRSIIYAAGLAYYAVFAIAPLLVFVVMVAGFFIGRSAAAAQIAEQAHYLVGPQLAGLLTELTAAVSRRTFSTGATMLSFIGLLLSATGIFTQLDKALNDIWGITTTRPQRFGDRLILLLHKTGPLMIVLFLGLLLGFSVLVDTLLATVSTGVAHIFPQVDALYPYLNWLIVPVLTFATFFVIFKWLPDARSRGRDVAVGALVTTIFFLVGRQVLFLYLDRSDTVSLFGTTGSIIVLLIWVYISAQILLFGAEFTKVYADRFGQPIVPRKLAVFVDTAQSVVDSPVGSDLTDH
jgi:membrane protein